MLLKTRELTVNGVCDLIGRLADIFQSDKCANCFKSYSFEPNERKALWPFKFRFETQSRLKTPG